MQYPQVLYSTRWTMQYPQVIYSTRWTMQYPQVLNSTRWTMQYPQVLYSTRWTMQYPQVIYSTRWTMQYHQVLYSTRWTMQYHQVLYSTYCTRMYIIIWFIMLLDLISDGSIHDLQCYWFTEWCQMSFTSYEKCNLPWQSYDTQWPPVPSFRTFPKMVDILYSEYHLF